MPTSSSSPIGDKHQAGRLAYFPPVASMQAGVMAAAPEGADFQARFTGGRLRAV